MFKNNNSYNGKVELDNDTTFQSHSESDIIDLGTDRYNDIPSIDSVLLDEIKSFQQFGGAAVDVSVPSTAARLSVEQMLSGSPDKKIEQLKILARIKGWAEGEGIANQIFSTLFRSPGEITKGIGKSFSELLTSADDKLERTGKSMHKSLTDWEEKGKASIKSRLAGATVKAPEPTGLNKISFKEFLLGKLGSISVNLPKCVECGAILKGERFCPCQGQMKHAKPVCAIETVKELSKLACVAKELTTSLNLDGPDKERVAGAGVASGAGAGGVQSVGGARKNKIYNTILDPITDKHYSITSNRGKEIVNQYILQYNSFILKNIYES